MNDVAINLGPWQCVAIYYDGYGEEFTGYATYWCNLTMPKMVNTSPPAYIADGI